MRILALAAVGWSLVGMPTLCRAGILVECCTLGIPGHEKSHGAPDQCPNQCPDDGEKCLGGTGPSEPRDCDSCTESCNVISPHSKQTDGDDFAVILVSVIAVSPVRSDAFLLHHHCSRHLNSTQFGEHIPVPASERPLLI